LWIDKEKFIIRKIETSTKTNGTFSIDLIYNDFNRFNLPGEMIFTFNIERLNLPRGMTGELDSNTDKQKGKRTTGKVFIKYSNYTVNQGLPDSIFENK
jgi:outer membrane lipoprotein-sorting protein